MNKYEEKMTNVVQDFSDGIWFKNDNVKVGYSFAETVCDYKNLPYGVEGDIFIISEYEDILKSAIYNNWEDVFKNNLDVKFVINKDCAEKGNFITWQQFKDALDDKGKVDIVSF